jgi:hypothetical protein
VLLTVLFMTKKNNMMVPVKKKGFKIRVEK